MNHAHRSAFIAVDCYPVHGGCVRLAEMIPAHLINAWLKALERGEQDVADRLAWWAERRGFVNAAMEEVKRRNG